MRPFTLVRHESNGYNSPPPSAGEEVALELSTLAHSLHEQANELGSAQPYVADYRARKAVIFYHLAADAFELAASASIGHNRTERYLSAAGDLRSKAEKLEKGEKADA